MAEINKQTEPKPLLLVAIAVLGIALSLAGRRWFGTEFIVFGNFLTFGACGWFWARLWYLRKE